ncbi:MAG: PLP-dependent aspartate aminotransferase family protein [Methanomassiliicoccales archaeon]|jgi:cystathionine gamma-lyase
MRFETKAIHEGEGLGTTENGDVVTPIHMASTFARKRTDEPTNGYEYSRSGNPTRIALEKKLAAIEGGYGALAFASGLAAETTAMFLLRNGARVLVCNDLYGGTYRLFNKCFKQFGLEFTFVDLGDHDHVRKELERPTDMLWIETPTNPLLHIYDIKRLSKLAHERDPRSLVVVDNTFASPYFQRPLEQGADVVVHSTTKYIGGHSDVVGGALIAKDENVFGRLKFYQNALGGIPSPVDSFLTLRGIKTLHVRMERHQENAKAIAEYLSKHDLVRRVHYPGLNSHPQHALAKEQMSGFSGMMSFELVPEADPLSLIESTRVFALAESLGGVESLIEHPSSMTHASIPREEREKAGLSDGLIRLSIGIEAIDDLIADLEQALDGSVSTKRTVKR